jgi:hypothetical protein
MKYGGWGEERKEMVSTQPVSSRNTYLPYIKSKRNLILMENYSLESQPSALKEHIFDRNELIERDIIH